MILIELKTKLGITVFVNLHSIDAVYAQQNKGDWGILLRSGITYMIMESEFQKIKDIIQNEGKNIRT